MGLYSKTVLFARRLSVFYLLIGVFAAFFGVFYLRFMPANQAEMNSRGFRILNQLARNLQARDQTLEESFSNLQGWVHVDRNENLQTARSIRKEGKMVRNQIRDHVRFEVALLPELKVVNNKPIRRPDTILDVGKYGWSMVYQFSDTDHAIVRMQDFADPVFAAREDLFESYVLLEGPQKDSGRRMNVLYLQHEFSPADRLSADSALGQERNTDLEAVSDVVIGGQTFTLFIQSFELAGKRLAIGGLVTKAAYENAAKSLPTGFIVAMVLIIFLGLMILPFVKIFFISPGETMQRSDVIKVSLAVYLGMAVLVLAAWYFIADYSAQSLVEGRLEQVSNLLERDIQRDFDSAEEQLNGFAARYDALPNNYKKVLAYQDFDTAHIRQVDQALRPSSYPLVVRLMWFDSSGNTLAKWNPFNFTSPPSSVTAYSYYTDLLRKEPTDTQIVLSAGQSNITSEFQFFATRRVRQRFDYVIRHGDGVSEQQSGPVYSTGMLMAFFLHCGLQPVLPKGFGFCLVDNRTMGVLMHSDSRRNLSENLYLETGSNQRLKNRIDNGVKAIITGVDLYGSGHSLYVRPIDGRNMSLVVFYDNETHAENILRMLHFGGETMLYLGILTALCLWASVISAGKPSKLSFKLEAIEWIRPVPRNMPSYGFNSRFFASLIVLGLFFFIAAWSGWADIRVAYYVALLLPLWALLGHVAARRRMRSRFNDDLPANIVPWVNIVLLVLLNWGIFKVIANPQMEQGSAVSGWIICFDVVAACVFCCCFVWLEGRFKRDAGKGNCGHAYSWSFYFSAFVFSLLPAVGILSYAWSVEKVQYARNDELFIAEKNRVHMDFASSRVLGKMKPDVRAEIYSEGGADGELVRCTGQYLAPEAIGYRPIKDWLDSLPKKRPDIDDPYIVILDKVFLITAGEYEAYSIGRASEDSSWSFAVQPGNRIGIGQAVNGYSVALPTGIEKIAGSEDALMQDFTVKMPLSESLFNFSRASTIQFVLFFIIVAALLGFLRLLLKLAVNRIFLLDFFCSGKPRVRSVVSPYFSGGSLPEDFCQDAAGKDLAALPVQEAYILGKMLEHDVIYQTIWGTLSRRQRYLLYDFANDGYTNYKEAENIVRLYMMGVLVYDEREGCGQLRFFAISFREFIMRKKGTAEITQLKEKYAVPGLWATIRIPALIVIAACAVLLVMTQETVTHRVTVAITSVGAIVPVVLEITRKLTGKGS